MISASSRAQDRNALFEQVFGKKSNAAAPQDIDIELTVESRAIGTLKIPVSGNSVVSLPKRDFINAVEPLLRSEAIEKIDTLPDPLTTSGLNALGIATEYQPSRLKLALEIDPNLRKAWDIQISPVLPPDQTRTRYMPASVAAAANLETTWLNDPFSGSQVRTNIDPFLHWNGWVLEGGGNYSSQTSGFQRTAVQLSRDIPDQNLRIAIGELIAPGFGMQPAQPLYGLLLQNDLSMDPYDPPFPDLKTPLLLQQRSTVEIWVNNRLVDSFRAPAGPLALQDFNLSPGLNDVELRVLNERGGQRSISLNAWFDRIRLDRGRQRFHLGIGSPWTQGSRYPLHQSPVYVAGAYARGLSDRLTLGASWLSDHSRNAINVEILSDYGFNHTALQSSISVSRRPLENLGWHGRMSLRNYGNTRSQWSWQTELEYRSGDYVPWGNQSSPGALWQARARFSRALGKRSRVGFAWQAQHNQQDTQHRIDARFQTRLSNKWDLQLSTQWNAALGDNDVIVGATVVWQPSDSQQQWRAESDSTSFSQTQWQYQHQNAHSGFGVAAAAFSEGGNLGYGADANLHHQRGALTLSTLRTPGASDSRSRITASTAIVFADGHWGITDRVTDSFVVFAANEDAGTVYVNPQLDDWLARSDIFGNPVVANLSPYLQRGFTLELPEVSIAQDVGETLPVAAPTRKSGIVVKVGPPPTTTVHFRLVTKSGKPQPLKAGQLQDTDTDQSRRFFSNRSGEVLISAVSPGRYTLVVDDTPISTIAPIIIKAAQKPVHLGDITL